MVGFVDKLQGKRKRVKRTKESIQQHISTAIRIATNHEKHLQTSSISKIDKNLLNNEKKHSTIREFQRMPAFIQRVPSVNSLTNQKERIELNGERIDEVWILTIFDQMI